MTTQQCGFVEQLAAAIIGLPRNLRAVFVMANVQGKSRGEIAAALGISERRVDRRKAKALRLCRERLLSQGIDPVDFR
ncbi:MAG: sigma factor-like helix-turn-helix DNA-binding protein [Pseudomonadota bacterium]|jgi:DNA-directed RNA polymerase specialized sigma24 family protein|nr:sigma factor-like helix-turn-helix DNA-binding protein [Pseudomonadota bacterium]